jgi:hypothetical protein
MTTRKTTSSELRRCTGSARFGIEPHEAPISEFPTQPSRKDGLGVMCAVHWKAYLKGLTADRKDREVSPVTDALLAATAEPRPANTKRQRPAPEPKPESPRVRKARDTIAATETLAGAAYTEAVGSDEVQAALETLNGHATNEPDDGQLLVAGVLYDSETLEEADAA